MAKTGNHIGRTAGRVRFLAVGMAVFIVVTHGLAVLGGIDGVVRVEGRSGPGPNGWISVATILASGACDVMALWCVIRATHWIEAGESFSLGVVRGLRGFAALAALGAAVSLVGQTLARAQSGQVALVLDLAGIWMLFVCALIFLCARLIERAISIDAENRRYV